MVSDFTQLPAPNAFWRPVYLLSRLGICQQPIE
jgi:hypothetical protein